eukprot:Gregarina_sp_Poly_1__1585@NODE_13_length_23366_cov_172_320786_g11_i0_p8_GENE_NODE_13_length_23366_cov_172_320786_g11_i0NODE_13_length_23366_cov_172_320786_g11_i0_p8_ORF_typecomplete_len154_score18_28RBB1NT/PF08169_11/3_5RBB1NT/PF08169_11/40_NODE_13_length_23366_cov_172_320786_g11_i01363914100
MTESDLTNNKIRSSEIVCWLGVSLPKPADVLAPQNFNSNMGFLRLSIVLLMTTALQGFALLFISAPLNFIPKIFNIPKPIEPVNINHTEESQDPLIRYFKNSRFRSATSLHPQLLRPPDSHGYKNVDPLVRHFQDKRLSAESYVDKIADENTA